MTAGAQPEPASTTARDRTATWVGTTYFAEGLPYMLVRYLAGVYLTDLGFREAWLGLLNLLGIPWNLKFLWAPAVDLFGTRRGWLTRVQGALVAGFGLLAVLAALGPLEAGAGGAESLGSHWTIPMVLGLLVALAVLSATHDIAIDGYYMEAIPDPTRQAAYTGLRVMTYRFAVIFTKSVLVAVAGYWAWSGAFLLGTLTLLALLLFHVRVLPRVEAPAERRSASQNLHLFGEAFLSWIRQDRILLILAFIATYKLGDEVLFSMNTPFLIRELGVSKAQLSWLAGVLGTTASIAGSLVSAWAIRRFGLRRAIWPLTLAMNLNLWAYVWLAWDRPEAATTSGIAWIAAVHAYEQFAAGLGNAVLVVFIMRICLPRYKAAHYAIASAISSVGSSLFGGLGGYIVEGWGYVTLFVLAFLAAVPSMAILLVLEVPEERTASHQKT
ncbi:MAG TPA: MFS transporter [Myxococcota bacterium]|nr:MFS transporter [Myxococcota bacterium]HQK50491.1 MFS transporter [Myxococcota bacterium]